MKRKKPDRNFDWIYESYCEEINKQLVEGELEEKTSW